jgi:RNA polymerase sigma-70 factor (ECF subfamily)
VFQERVQQEAAGFVDDTAEAEIGSDAALVQATLLGNHHAFRTLMERYLSLVAVQFHGRVAAAADAEDLLQETFLAAYRHLPTLRSPENFRPWLLKIARNQLALYHRGRRIIHPQDPPPDMQDPAPDPSQAAQQSEFALMVERVTGALPEKYRTVLYLSLREGQSLTQIALQLGLKESTARMQYLRGMKLLRQRLQKLGVLPPI